MLHRAALVLMVILLAAVAAGTTACEDAGRVGEPGPTVDRPDLVIESISYCRPPPTPVMGGGIEVEYTIRVKNIGNVASTGLLYVANSRSSEDFNLNRYSAGELLKYAEPSIAPGEVMDFTFTDFVDDPDVKRVRLMVNPNGTKSWPTSITEDDVEHDVSRERLEESNYDNNTYELALTADIPWCTDLEPKDEAPITKYTTTSTQYLVTGEPLTYTPEEIEAATETVVDPDLEKTLPEEAVRTCLAMVSSYVHAFPGYRYEGISGTVRTADYDEGVYEAVAGILAYGLSSGTVATKLGIWAGDHFSFRFRYDETTEKCEILSHDFLSRIIPEEVYDKAVSLAMEHPVVQDFVEDSKDYDSDIWKRSYELGFGGWMNEFWRESTRYAEPVDRIGFKRPVKGVVILELENTEYSSLRVYVDMYHGEVFTEGPVSDPPDKGEERSYSKYATADTRYLIEGEPVRHRTDEMSRAIAAVESLSEAGQQSCLDAIRDYVYAFPGYDYEHIVVTGGMRYSHKSNANVRIRIEGQGLSSGMIATYIGEEYGDSHRFDLRYDETTQECTLLSFHVFNWILPKEVFRRAELLAMEHPVVKDFIEESQDYELRFNEWIDGLKGKGSNHADMLNKINFREPVKGIVILELDNTRYSGLRVYVDVYNGEVFTEGPLDFSPD